MQKPQVQGPPSSAFWEDVVAGSDGLPGGGTSWAGRAQVFRWHSAVHREGPCPQSLELRPEWLFVRHLCLEPYAQRAFVFPKKGDTLCSMTRGRDTRLCVCKSGVIYTFSPV